ncbi:ATP-dependent DNA helicase UvrD/PcrA, proteobacterial paralog [Olavius algarvensis associated proteobacterium Delta 3]|nr:ATP-dependent DNA helicase UvrD/PcrA, proteobacterial paralog [Olavius algarvensis associated proteobacterium Delta 3]CAB5125922.1 ATP-dependent DNA helicase UvrD/PcrA, proteobacterial paralog [Olavius algarvensis associated proteobacterium Delta 3]
MAPSSDIFSGKNFDRALRIPYSDELNPVQLEAVEYTEGPLLVIAGAGSGKTRTITYRVARLVEEQVPPESILLLTFTRKASQEMLARAADLLDDRCARVAGGTFHSFANMVLRRHARCVGYTAGFSILDRADSESLLGIIRKEMGPSVRTRSFPKKQTLANIISRSVNKGQAIEDVVYDDYPHFTSCLDDILAMATAYRRRKREHQFLDYDDLLIYLQMLLVQNPDIRDRLSAAYRYIMVDEYQDTNHIQADIVYRLGEIHRNVMVVGDDAQSIYAFRGANFENIFRFPEMFSDTKIIRLEENYRSIQPILTLTNCLIEQAQQKFSKTLFTRKTGGDLPVLVATGDENTQSRYIVEKIMELREQQVPLHQIAILFRAGFHSFDLEIELGRENIPFIKYGGFKFVESAHIKDVLAHLKVIANPADRVSWYRILLLIEKIGPKTAQVIYNAIQHEGTGHSGFLSISQKSRNPEGVENLKALFSTLDREPMSLFEIGEVLLAYYFPLLRGRYDDYPKRAKDLEQLLAIMERYRNIEEFLADMALEPPTASIENRLSSRAPSHDHLVLSTVHSAKGLEWQAVFVIWALDGRFPSIHALRNETELEEELRLMYVAATRARERLHFTYPIQGYDRGADMFLTHPSRFLEYIPSDVLERLEVGIDGYYDRY